MNLLLAFAIGFTVFTVDQFLKLYLARLNNFIVLKNQGILFFEGSWCWWLWLLVSLILVIGIIINKNPKIKLGEILILAGVLSNFIDRLFRGGVIDYLNIYSKIFFNLADLAIIFGLMIYLYQMVFYEKK